jgi:hypothetical protein
MGRDGGTDDASTRDTEATENPVHGVTAGTATIIATGIVAMAAVKAPGSKAVTRAAAMDAVMGATRGAIVQVNEAIAMASAAATETRSAGVIARRPVQMRDAEMQDAERELAAMSAGMTSLGAIRIAVNRLAAEDLAGSSATRRVRASRDSSMWGVQTISPPPRLGLTRELRAMMLGTVHRMGARDRTPMEMLPPVIARIEASAAAGAVAVGADVVAVAGASAMAARKRECWRRVAARTGLRPNRLQPTGVLPRSERVPMTFLAPRRLRGESALRP